jgi:thiopurine S-methyltransferase
MENNYWYNKWRSQDIAFHEQNVNSDLIAYIHLLNLHPGDRIFVPLCGKTKDMLWLAKQGFYVIGVELSPIACNDFFAEMNVSPEITKLTKFTRYQHTNIELLCGNIFDLTPSDLPTVNAMYDCKALIALPSDVKIKYVNHIISCLNDNIKILLLTLESDCAVKPPPYPIDGAEVNELYGSYFDVQQLKSSIITEIPQRRLEKGFLQMKESVYLITSK